MAVIYSLRPWSKVTLSWRLVQLTNMTVSTCGRYPIISSVFSMASVPSALASTEDTRLMVEVERVRFRISETRYLGLECVILCSCMGGIHYLHCNAASYVQHLNRRSGPFISQFQGTHRQQEGIYSVCDVDQLDR